ncbi:hypothetical protein [Brevifollis gellanilyticus]|uniref:Uncharacterized protein n=1 Tax=Brevifollis gellanilyticus TaxID=748831 RepID=A0A512MBR6_9BACT|nr:hypothetical protein [Brevifollis gellanilyticus]GEP44185.1 hypothetical protein BGE01nite_34760 [Brevifollis gellanilyticus]
MNLSRSLLLITWLGMSAARGVEPPQQTPPSNDDDGAIPQAFNTEDFQALMSNSPFTRTLGVSDSVILTGIAHFDNETYATLLDTKTMESQVVSKTPNFHGWQLVGVGGDPANMMTWSAKVQVPGGQTVSIRYQKPPAKLARKSSGGSSGSSGSSSRDAPPLSKSQTEEAKNAAVNYREGFSSDGYPQKPPAAMVEKLSKLSVGQREDINKQMLGLRNRGLGLDERRKIYESMVDRSLQGRR